MATSRSFASTSVTSRSPISMVPSVGSSSPAIMRSAVDLPQPDGPRSTRNSSSATSRVKLSTAVTSPNRFETPRMATRPTISSSAPTCWSGENRPASEGPASNPANDRRTATEHRGRHPKRIDHCSRSAGTGRGYPVASELPGGLGEDRVGPKSMRRRRQAGADPRVPDGSDTRSRAPTDDPDELVIRTTPGGGRFTYVSPNVRSILGYGPEELLAQPPLDGVHPDDLTRAKTTGDRVAGGTDR